MDLHRAMVAAAASDLFVAVGTSLVVHPVNQMFTAAARRGTRTAILTASETPFDADTDWKLTDPLERVLPAVRTLIGDLS
jgi:NAD-dependent deacetylase